MSMKFKSMLDVCPSRDDGTQNHESEGEKGHWCDRAAEPKNLAVCDQDGRGAGIGRSARAVNVVEVEPAFQEQQRRCAFPDRLKEQRSLGASKDQRRALAVMKFTTALVEH